MFNRNEFLESSSSSEDISSKPRESTTSTQNEIENHISISHITPKPLQIRPISANTRILSIQRAKLLNRGNDSIRVETSPFFRGHTQNNTSFCENKEEAKKSKKPKEVKKIHKEEIEEIKIQEFSHTKEKVNIRKFLRPESPERIDPNIIRPESRNNEITPEPRYQRVSMSSNKTVRERPVSQVNHRRDREFKTVTTVSARKNLASNNIISPNFKSSSFLPVPLGSCLHLVLIKQKEELDKSNVTYLIKILSTGIFMFTCKRRKSGSIIFSLRENEFSKKSESFLGRVVRKKNGKLFKFYDYGSKLSSGDKGRKHYGSCIYVKSI